MSCRPLHSTGLVLPAGIVTEGVSSQGPPPDGLVRYRVMAGVKLKHLIWNQLLSCLCGEWDFTTSEVCARGQVGIIPGRPESDRVSGIANLPCLR